ncbi:MAG: endonuclease NucS, partial [Actinomycetota bacterium]
NPKGETLTVYLHDVISDFSHELGQDPGLIKDGVEADLQVLLAAMPETIEPGLILIRREYPIQLLSGRSICFAVTQTGKQLQLRLNDAAKLMASNN